MMDENNILMKLKDVLEKLLRANPDIIVAMITSMEGLPIISIIPRNYEETKISAMVAALLSLSQRVVLEMEIGVFNQLYIKGDDGYLLVFEADPALLAVSTTSFAKLGLIIFECGRASHEIMNILKGKK
ncbi:MAG: roadblock/LC7 domain-containing protein [Candidatus Thorarchaeota archaeon]